MENIGWDKLYAYSDRVLGKCKPITADIFLNNYCNNRCPYCTFRRWELDEGARAMSYEEFVRYATRLKELGVMGYILTGGGEPTITPDFMGITGWLEKNNLHYGVNTNFNKLVMISPDYLKVSLDGWDEDSYEEARGVRRYAEVKENIEAYAEWKRKNSPKTNLGIQMVAGSPEDVKRFYRANRNLHVDYIVFRPKESTAGECYRGEKAQAEVEAIKDEIYRLMVADGRVKMNPKWVMLGMKQETCTAQWSQMALNERGEVMYCCHKPYQIVGHVLDDDILEKKEKAGTNMAMCDIPCRLTGPNMAAKEILKHSEMFSGGVYESHNAYFI